MIKFIKFIFGLCFRETHIMIRFIRFVVSLFKDKSQNNFKYEHKGEKSKKDINSSYTKVNDIINDFTVIDFETTGLDPYSDCIIQIGGIRYRNDEKVDKFNSYVNPLKPIPKRITKLTGIKDKDLKYAPTIDSVISKFVEFIGHDVIIAHNASFDIKFLLVNMFNCNINKTDFKVIDTLALARKYIKDENGKKLNNYKLETLKEILNIRVESHNALDDCLVCGEVYKECKKTMLYKKIKHNKENYNDGLNSFEYSHKNIQDIYLEKFEYDIIDKDIYKCFIANKTGMCDVIGNWRNFEKVEEKLSIICKENGGRLYKTPAKSAKFAIIFSYTHRTALNVNKLRSKGYKVISFEDMIDYFKLQDTWDTSGLIKMVNKHREFMIKYYNS